MLSVFPPLAPLPPFLSLPFRFSSPPSSFPPPLAHLFPLLLSLIFSPSSRSSFPPPPLAHLFPLLSLIFSPSSCSSFPPPLAHLFALPLPLLSSSSSSPLYHLPSPTRPYLQRFLSPIGRLWLPALRLAGETQRYVTALLRLHSSYREDQVIQREAENGLVEAVAVLLAEMPILFNPSPFPLHPLPSLPTSHPPLPLRPDGSTLVALIIQRGPGDSARSGERAGGGSGSTAGGDAHSSYREDQVIQREAENGLVKAVAVLLAEMLTHPLPVPLLPTCYHSQTALLRLHSSYREDQLIQREAENGLVEAVAVLLAEMPMPLEPMAAHDAAEVSAYHRHHDHWRNRLARLKASPFWAAADAPATERALLDLLALLLGSSPLSPLSPQTRFQHHDHWRNRLARLKASPFWPAADAPATERALLALLDLLLGSSRAVDDVARSHWLELLGARLLHQNPQATAAAQASLALQCWREAAAGGGGKSAGTSQPLDASDLVQPSLDRLMLASLCHETEVGK
ncbi:unnamed protein product [Closterium sp. Naga37s-1]|nr:unnamed protein product [Closterium sp. Naga37s-1]